MLALFPRLALATVCLLPVPQPVVDDLVGGPACPGACPNSCPIMTQTPMNSGNSCITIEATWTRLQDGCGDQTCAQCRQCLGRLRIVISASAQCYFDEGGPIKTSWESQTQVEPPPPATPPLPTGSGTGGLALQPDGSYSSTDVRDLIANCGASASYSGTATSGNMNSTSVSASYLCDACSPSEE